MDRITDDFKSNNPTNDRFGNGLPEQFDSDAQTHIDQFFSHLDEKEAVSTAYDLVVTESNLTYQSETQKNLQDAQNDSDKRRHDSANDNPLGADKKKRKPRKTDKTENGFVPKQKRQIVAVSIAFVVCASMLGVGLYVGLPKILDFISSSHTNADMIPAKGEINETITAPVASTVFLGEYFQQAESTTAKQEEPTTDPDLKYAPGTYYIDVGSGTPLYSDPSYFSVVKSIVPKSEKVKVTEVKVGRGLDGKKINFGKVSCDAQTGWIKMDCTAEKQSTNSSKEIDYDAVLQCNVEYWKDYGNDDVLSAFAGEVNLLVEEYGTGRIGETKENPKELCGLFVVRLIDLDQDGQPELYCAYAKEGESEQAKRQAIYRYNGYGRTEQLYEGEYTAKGSDYSPFVWFRENNGELFFVAGDGPERYYYSLKDGEFNGICFAGWAGSYIDGQEVTADEYNKALEKYSSNAIDYTISIYGYSDYSPEHSTYIDSILSETARVVDYLAPYESADSEVSFQPSDVPESDIVPHDRPWEDDFYQWDSEDDDYDWY